MIERRSLTLLLNKEKLNPKKFLNIWNDGNSPPREILFAEFKQNIYFAEFKENIYNEIGEIKAKAKKASYEELRNNPKQLEYDTRTQAALEGNPIEQVTPEKREAYHRRNREMIEAFKEGLAQDNKETFG